MPTYEYRCLSCEHQFERFQRMSDDPIKECEVCGEPVKRLLFPVAIQFKGNGFYTTDYARRSSLASAGASSGNGDGSESSGSESSGSESSSKSANAGSSDNAKSAASGSSEAVPASATKKSD